MGSVRLSTGMVIDDISERPEGSEEGYSDCYSFQSGNLDTIISNVTFREDFERQITGPNLLKLGFFARADLVHFRFDRTIVDASVTSTCLYTIHPEGMTKYQRNEEDTRVESVLLILTPGFVSETLSASSEHLPTNLKHFAAGKFDDFQFDRMPMGRAAQQCVADLLNIGRGDSLSRLLIEAKSLELFHGFCDALRGDASQSFADFKLRPHDRKRLEDVRNLLDSVYMSPPTLESMANDMGMSRSKLVSSFRKYFSISIGDYCLSLRMREAQRLIRGDNEPLQTIAYRVGYEHQSSFSSAYKQFFGITPGEERLQTRS